jgi:rhodanese-related sulfurtransferase
MQQFIDYLGHHPLLAAAAALALVVVVVYEFLASAQSSGALSTMQAVRLINQGALVIDVRTRAAYDAGHIGDARNIPAATLGSEAEALKKWRDRNVIVYCDTGRDAASAVRALAKLGFTKAASIDGGIAAWTKDNLPVSRSGGGGPVAV